MRALLAQPLTTDTAPHVLIRQLSPPLTPAPPPALRSMASPTPQASPARRSAESQAEPAARRDAYEAARATQLPQDDEQQAPAVHPSDADIKAVCAFCAASGEAPAPLGVPKGVELRMRRAAARARDTVERRKASERQVVAYLELLDEKGAPRCCVLPICSAR